MKKNLTELVFILDKSGSMCGLESDTTGGFNAMMEKQKKEDGEALISVVLFNDYSEVLYDRKSIDTIEKMTDQQYTVSGCTALLDAMGDAIHHISNVHKYIREEDVPEKTIFIITTDGMENASRRYTAAKIREMISKKKEIGWEFMFLGANIDAVKEAARYGISEDRAVRFENDSTGIELNYRVLSATVGKMRKADRTEPVGACWKEEIEEDFRNRTGNF